MVKRSVLLAIFGMLLLSCEDEPEQGPCGEGFIELPGPEGSDICVPIAELEAINETLPDSNYLNDSE